TLFMAQSHGFFTLVLLPTSVYHICMPLHLLVEEQEFPWAIFLTKFYDLCRVNLTEPSGPLLSFREVTKVFPRESSSSLVGP
ncbi:hypothetical protein L9F63_000583, partial [Diploptera punctata]